MSLDDPILGSAFLTMVTEFYVESSGANQLEDFLLSPRLTPDSLLQKFPPTRISIAGLCPLRDEQLKLVIRMAQLGCNIMAKEYKNFPHCFQSMGKSHGIKEYDEANKEILDSMVELVNLAH